MSIIPSWLAKRTTVAPTLRLILVKLKLPGMESTRFYQELKKNKTQVTKLVIDGKDISHDPYEVCNIFHSYFTEVGLTLASKSNYPRVSFRDFIKPSHTNFELKLVTVDVVS